jgi:pimeloyl-ACP methyl ester carboxylesterase
MNENNVYVLIHSPLVGPLTWKLVADQMRQRGIQVIIPALIDLLDSEEPYWKQHAESVSKALASLPKDNFVTLVAHSGSGPLLAVIRQFLENPVHAYVFVDAGIPRAGATRLDLMYSEDSEWAQQFQAHLQSGGRFPDWSVDDLQEIIPEESLRAQMVAEIHSRALDFFTEPIPVFESWPDAPCVYILFSEPYKSTAVQARESGWDTYELEAGHFHMLVDAKVVTDLIVNSTKDVSSKTL